MRDQKVVSRDVEVQTGLAFAFLIVCLVNTIGLLLAKFTRKAGEIGLRRALGASRREVFTQFLIESGVVGLTGGVLGLLLTGLGLVAVRALYKQYNSVAHLDWTMVAMTIVLAIVSAAAGRALSDLARLPRAAGGAVEDVMSRESGSGNRESQSKRSRIHDAIFSASRFPIPHSRIKAMEIRPILSALMRSKVSMILIGLQVALTLAIVCNALFIIGQRLDRMNRPSGMNEADTFSVGSNGFGQGFDVKTTQLADLALLRQLPGVAAATSTNSVPMSNGGWGSGIRLQPQQKTSTAQSAFYLVDAAALDTFGVNLVAGRNFKPEEIASVVFGDRLQPPVIIVSKALADRLFPDGDALGKQVYLEDDPPTSTIVGIVERLQQPWMRQRHDRVLDFLAGLHALRQLHALPGARRARPSRRGHEDGRAEARGIEHQPHHRQAAQHRRTCAPTPTPATVRWRSSSAR